ncbi:MAG: hypothetical protein KA411_07945, partial [Limnohabitans sp.]|nr:hypothetical protein [Limnohabitans sp.]
MCDSNQFKRCAKPYAFKLFQSRIILLIRTGVIDDVYRPHMGFTHSPFSLGFGSLHRRPAH